MRNRRPQAPPAHVADRVHAIEREVDRLRYQAEHLHADGQELEAKGLWHDAKEMVREANALRNSEA